MDKITYNFKIEMSKEDAEYFEDLVHSVSIYYAGRGKTKYCFREIKQYDEIDRKILEWIREKSSNDAVSDEAIRVSQQQERHAERSDLS
jgi:hypothetical protein